MKIETKLNIKDECYFLHQNTIKKCIIEKIKINVFELNLEIKYEIKFNSFLYLEKDLFKTKQELLDSL